MTGSPLSKAQAAELEALEFPVLVSLLASFARTATGRARLAALHPWDGRSGLRRLRQMELLDLWQTDPAALPLAAMDEALDQLLDRRGWLLPEHWRQLREGLEALARLLGSTAALPWPAERPAPEGTHLGIDRLQVTAAILESPAPIVARLRRDFDAEGRLDPLRVPGLAERHRARQHAFGALQNKLQKLLRDSPEAFREPNIVERNGRFCLPVRMDRKPLVPGLVLDRSGTGSTVFVEPFDAVGLNNAYVEADREYQEAVQAYLREFLETLRARRREFEAWRAFQADVDETLALLRWQGLCDGHLADRAEGRVTLLRARHPLLLSPVREALGMAPLGHEVVPLELDLPADQPCLVISGSNTGGKTVALKTVGLLAALAHAGCAIPVAPGTGLPALASLHADIGDHQTLAGSLSTFSSHILHLKRILAQARAGGLVLLDELGTGTDPREGAALGIAVLQALHRRRCWVLCSTHLGEISQWALQHRGFRNGSVTFDEAKLEPTYRLQVGMPGQSRALTIAQRLGLPPAVLDHAQRVLGKREQDWREFLRKLEADRLALEREAASLRAREAAVEKDRRILRDREEALRSQQEKHQREAEEKVQRVLAFLDHEGRRLVKDLKERQKEAARQGFSADRAGNDARAHLRTLDQIARAELAPLAPAARSNPEAPALQVGGYARHRGLRLEGRIEELDGQRAVLRTSQGRRVQAHPAELEALGRKDLGTVPPAGGRVRVRVDSQVVESELNLIGRASDDVEFEVHRFVEQALAAGHRFIRIVHGHGTGRLKAAVREALRGHPAIAGVEDAVQAQGGAGATVITLR